MTFSLRTLSLTTALALAAILSPAAHAYIDGPVESLTLPKVLLEFPSVSVFQVDRVDRERGVILYKPVEWLQGPEATGIARHAVGTGDAFKKIKPGDRAVLFGPDPYGRGLALIEGIWYISVFDRSDGWWRNALSSYDLNCCFQGTVPELTAAIRSLHRGHDVTAKCRVKSNAAPTQWVSYNLREAKRKTVVSAPKAPPAAPSAAKASVAELTSKLRDPSLDNRVSAAEGLTHWGVAAKPATAVLVEIASTEKDPLLRRFAAIALGRIGGDARSALPALIALVQGGYEDASALTGVEAVIAIRKIDPHGEALLPLIGPLLQKDPEINVRRRAVNVINLVGPPLKNAQPLLLAAMKSDIDADVRFGAAFALVSVKADTAVVVPALIDALSDKSEFVRMTAAKCLAALGEASRPAIPHLKRALNDSNGEVRQYAETALAAIPKK